jgi:hypothetical protein
MPLPPDPMLGNTMQYNGLYISSLPGAAYVQHVAGWYSSRFWNMIAALVLDTMKT